MKISYFFIYESSEYYNVSLKDCINIAHFLNIQCILYELLSEFKTDQAASGFNTNSV